MVFFLYFFFVVDLISVLAMGDQLIDDKTFVFEQSSQVFPKSDDVLRLNLISPGI